MTIDDLTIYLSKRFLVDNPSPNTFYPMRELSFFQNKVQSIYFCLKELCEQNVLLDFHLYNNSPYKKVSYKKQDSKLHELMSYLADNPSKVETENKGSNISHSLHNNSYDYGFTVSLNDPNKLNSMISSEIEKFVKDELDVADYKYEKQKEIFIKFVMEYCYDRDNDKSVTIGLHSILDRHTGNIDVLRILLALELEGLFKIEKESFLNTRQIWFDRTQNYPLSSVDAIICRLKQKIYRRDMDGICVRITDFQPLLAEANKYYKNGIKASKDSKTASIDQVDGNIHFEVRKIDNKIWVNDRYLVGKPNFDQENELIFEYVFNNPDKDITKQELEQKLEITIKKTLSKVINELGFTGEIRKAFFVKSSNKSIIRFRKVLTINDIVMGKINKELFIKELETQHLRKKGLISS